jgi:hypothetical protein
MANGETTVTQRKISFKSSRFVMFITVFFRIVVARLKLLNLQFCKY